MEGEIIMGGHPWTEEQKTYLKEIAGTDHIFYVLKKFKTTSTKRGWPKRSDNAIKVKIKRYGLSRVASDGGWSCASLADLLEVNKDLVHSWVENNGLRSSRPPGYRHHRITDQDFREFARTNPERLTIVKPENLRILLDKETVEAIQKTVPTRRGKPIPVVSLKTYKSYRSLREAARHEYFSRSTIKDCADRQRRTRDGVGLVLERAC
jgi:hypothetical protein